jgi:hypothetical protein
MFRSRSTRGRTRSSVTRLKMNISAAKRKLIILIIM